jgi:sRNA-binding carbon storage regulator CsrA
MTLHEHETVFVDLPDGRTVAITVVEVKRGKVRLGFAADPAVPINRREVQDAIEWRKARCLAPCYRRS